MDKPWRQWRTLTVWSKAANLVLCTQYGIIRSRSMSLRCCDHKTKRHLCILSIWNSLKKQKNVHVLSDIGWELVRENPISLAAFEKHVYEILMKLVLLVVVAIRLQTKTLCACMISVHYLCLVKDDPESEFFSLFLWA